MIYVSPLSAVEEAVESLGPSHLVSLLDPETMIDTPPAIAADRHLQLGVNDIATLQDDLTPPGIEHVESLIEFVHGWDQDAPLLIHCWAGISRSTAAAFISLCTLNEGRDEAALAQLIRQHGPHANPNRLMVALADEVLGRRGAMVRAVEALGPGKIAWEGTLFGVPARVPADASVA